MNPINILIGGGIFCIASLVYSGYSQTVTVNNAKEQCESKGKVHIQIDLSHYCIHPDVLEVAK